MKIDGETAARMVLGRRGAVKHSFRLDTRDYSWVDGYLSDLKIRQKVAALSNEIKEIQALPTHKEELKAAFLSAIEKINGSRERMLVEHLREVQENGAPMINGLMINQRKMFNEMFDPFPVSIPKAEIERIFSALEDGTPQSEKDARVATIREEIKALMAEIERDFNPISRWYYRDHGIPDTYPVGCRWTQFVDAWMRVAARFDSPVDIDGAALQTDQEHRAYVALGLHEIRKIPPLSKPW